MRSSKLVVPVLLLAAACGGGGGKAAPSATPTTAAVAPTVSMSIKDGAHLAAALTWQVDANPHTGDDVVEVSFLVDGKQLWSEHSAPYYFNDDFELLTPWLLGAGAHVLSVHVTTAKGASADATAHVTVTAEPSMNKGLVGTYRRTVTAADQQRTSPYRTPAKGAFGELTPTGVWTLKVRANGEIVGIDPSGDTGGAFVEPYTLRGSTLRLYGPAVWRQQDPSNPSKFCEAEPPGDYTWSLSGGSLKIVNASQVCADRDTLFVGTWKRV